MHAAMIKGAQPPSTTLTRLAATKATSMVMNAPATAMLTGRLHPHISRIARYIKIDVSNIVSDTAMP
jgi:hypothetical protein